MVPEKLVERISKIFLVKSVQTLFSFTLKVDRLGTKMSKCYFCSCEILFLQPKCFATSLWWSPYNLVGFFFILAKVIVKLNVTLYSIEK